MWRSLNYKELVLNNNDVHIWRGNFNLNSTEIEQFKKLLSDEEIGKAKRFRFAKHQEKYIICRGLLRTILGSYLQVNPEKLKFSYTAHGKPYLTEFKHLQFNLSHSEELVLYGITSNREIGIDVEYIKPFPEAEKLAKRFFSEQEFSLISNVSESEKAKVFFKIWTAKEAYLKAVGEGLSGGLNNIEINFIPQEFDRWFYDSEKTKQKWLLKSFTPKDDYLATVVIENNDQQNFNFLWLFYF